MGSPEVSVIIPTRDRRKLAEVAVACSLGQLDIQLEVIVVDDGSSDGTAAALSQLGGPQLRVIRHPRSLGVARARNRGIAESAGRWIAFLDDDDLWASNRLRRQIDVAERVGAGFGYSGRISVNARRQPIRATLPEPPEQIPERLLKVNVLGGPSAVIVRADVLRRIGGFHEQLSALADWDLWLALAAAEQGTACPDLLVGYMEHEGNMHLRDPLALVEEFGVLAARHRARTGTAVELDFDGYLGWMANESHSHGFRRRAVHLRLLQARAGRRFAPLVAAAYAAVGPALSGSPPTHLIPTVVGPPWLDEYKT